MATVSLKLVDTILSDPLLYELSKTCIRVARDRWDGVAAGLVRVETDYLRMTLGRHPLIAGLKETEWFEINWDIVRDKLVQLLNKRTEEEWRYQSHRARDFLRLSELAEASLLPPGFKDDVP